MTMEQAPVSHASADDKSAVTLATLMVKVPHVSDGIVLPSQDSLQPVRKELVADLCKIIEQQSKEIASLRDSAGKPAPAAAPSVLVDAVEEKAAQVADELPIAHSEIACAAEDEDIGSSSETQSTEDELPIPYGYVNSRKRPTPGLDVLTAAASNIANANATNVDDDLEEEASKLSNEHKEEHGAQRQCRNCGTTTTPKWRCGMTLCNACGLRSIKRQTTSRNLAALRQQEKEVQIVPSQVGGATSPMRSSELPPPAESRPQSYIAAPAAAALPQQPLPQRTGSAQVPLSSSMPGLTTTNMMQLTAQQVVNHMRMQSLGQAMCCNGMSHVAMHQPLFNNSVAQPPIIGAGMSGAICASGVAQPICDSGMAQPPIFSAMGQPVCTSGMCSVAGSPIGGICAPTIGQSPMFNNSCMGQSMAQQAMYNNGMAASLRMAQSQKLQPAVVNSAYPPMSPACGAGYNAYMAACAPAYAQRI